MKRRLVTATPGREPAPLVNHTRKNGRRTGPERVIGSRERGGGPFHDGSRFYSDARFSLRPGAGVLPATTEIAGCRIESNTF